MTAAPGVYREIRGHFWLGWSVWSPVSDAMVDHTETIHSSHGGGVRWLIEHHVARREFAWVDPEWDEPYISPIYLEGQTDGSDRWYPLAVMPAGLDHGHLYGLHRDRDIEDSRPLEQVKDDIRRQLAEIGGGSRQTR